LWAETVSALPFLNLALAGVALLVNQYWIQGFCQPVAWAAWVAAGSAGAFLAWPWLRETPGWVRWVALLLQGAFLLVCVYCAWFMALDPSLYYTSLVLSFLGFPLLVWVPVLFAAQVISRLIGGPTAGAGWAVAAGALALLAAQAWAELQYRAVETAVAGLPPRQQHDVAALARVVPRNYVAERLAGALFKYHNYPEFIYDGWRPPLHDPLVNVSLWCRNGRTANPLLMYYWDRKTGTASGSLEEQALLYRALFPQRPVKADCVCAQTGDGESYRGWHPEWDR